MSAETGIILNLSKLEVSNYQGDYVYSKKKFKTLEEAIEYAQEFGNTEYGVSIVGKLKKDKTGDKFIKFAESQGITFVDNPIEK